jgi:hypothetical protein
MLRVWNCSRLKSCGFKLYSKGRLSIWAGLTGWDFQEVVGNCWRMLANAQAGGRRALGCSAWARSLAAQCCSDLLGVAQLCQPEQTSFGSRLDWTRVDYFTDLTELTHGLMTFEYVWCFFVTWSPFKYFLIRGKAHGAVGAQEAEQRGHYEVGFLTWILYILCRISSTTSTTFKHIFQYFPVGCGLSLFVCLFVRLFAGSSVRWFVGSSVRWSRWFVCSLVGWFVCLFVAVTDINCLLMRSHSQPWWSGHCAFFASPTPPIFRYGWKGQIHMSHTHTHIIYI